MGSTVVEFMAAEAEEDKLAIVNRKVESTISKLSTKHIGFNFC